MVNRKLKKRIIDLSYKHRLSHIGSSLDAVDIIDEVFQNKYDRLVLSQGHAALALYVVLEKYLSHDAEYLYNTHGTHPNRKLKDDIYVSTGSLGHGLPIALGMAIAQPQMKIACLISDGECSEGSIWEALRIKNEQEVNNLDIILNFNGWGAYKSIDYQTMMNSLAFVAPFQVRVVRTTHDGLPFLAGQKGHYHVMSKADYELACNILDDNT